MFTRRPRRRPESRWREVLRASTPQGLYRWIHTSTRWVFRDQGRTRARPTHRSAEAELREALERFRRARLTPRQREVAIAKKLADRREIDRELAARLGMNPATFRATWRDAVAKLGRLYRAA